MGKGIRLKAIFFIFLGLLGFTVYWNALSAPFVFDDSFYIVKNPWIRSLKNFINPAPMRYVGDLSFALNLKLSGLNPASFHTVNVCIHIVNSFLVFFLVGQILEATSFRGHGGKDTGSTRFLIPALTATIFLVHPVNTQAVTYVSQRYTVLAAFFYLSSVSLYLRARSYPAQEGQGRGGGYVFYIASIASAVLAMKTKEVSFTLPFVISLLEVSLFQGTRAERLRVLRPFFITLLIIPASLLIDGPSGNKAEEFMRLKKLGDIEALSSWSYLLTQSKVVLIYVKLIFFPSGLHFDYHYPFSESLFEPRVLGSLAVLSSTMIFSAYLFILSLKRGWQYSFLIAIGAIWFFMTLSVESSVIPIKDAVNEHRLYLPGIGIFLSSISALFYLRDFLLRRGFQLKAGALVILVSAAIVSLSVAAYKRNTVWSDDLLLNIDEVSKNPFEPSPRINLGLAYANRGRLIEAAGEFRKALEFNPRHTVARRNLAAIYLKLERTEDAVKEYMVLAELSPEEISPHYNLGLIYIKKGRLSEAQAELVKVIELDPGNEKARLLLDDLGGGEGR